MFLVALLGTLSALAMVIAGSIAHPERTKTLVASYVFFYLIALLAVYVWLPSKSALSLIEINFVVGLLFMPVFVGIATPQTPKEKNIVKAGGLLLGILLIVAAFGLAQTTLAVKPLYQSLKVKTAKEAPLLDKQATPIAIAPQTVRNKMNKAMSTVPNTSYYQLGALQTQVVKGKAVYIAPVEFDGFWRWLRGKTTPGYFIIDATNVNAEPHFVKRAMRYAPSAYFDDDAQRVIYHRFPEWLQEGQPQLEVDDQGTPYYIQTVYKARGVSQRINYRTLHVVTLNAQTGATHLYATAQAPKFVNEAIASSTAAEMNQVFGQYARGFLNAHLSKTGVKLPNNNGTEHGVTPVVDKHGNISYFNDFTSPKTAADSTMGYSMIDARTGQLTYYTGKNIGVMDSDGAKKMADKEYVAQKWRATMPIMYNIDGTPTWVVSLLDSTGAFRSYAYIKAADQGIKAYAPNATEALKQYRVQLATAGATAGGTKQASTVKVHGTVARVAVVPNGQAQNVIFALKGNSNLWTASTDDFPQAVLLRANDKVQLTANLNKAAKAGTVKTLTNQTFKLGK